MDCIITTAVAFVSGLIGGFIASIFASGVRKMLAKLILPKKIRMGKILLSPEIIERRFPFYYVLVTVKANCLYNLLVSSIEDVKGRISFVDKDNTVRTYITTWWSPEIPMSSVSLRNGSKYQLIIASLYGNVVKAIGSIDVEDVLSESYDVYITLDSGIHTLVCWYYPLAIKNGVVQNESEPMRYSNGKTKFSQDNF